MQTSNGQTSEGLKSEGLTSQSLKHNQDQEENKRVGKMLKVRQIVADRVDLGGECCVLTKILELYLARFYVCCWVGCVTM